eukprot:c14312_g1_i3.p1 GENE.c14312_g1_i3~~c14312_g1_i3.p1  ORF type:complete len:171 (-),score=21.39 c14312_g1_i3:303-815(-)
MSMAGEGTTPLDSLRQQNAQQAQDAIDRIIPQKIQELTAWINGCSDPNEHTLRYTYTPAPDLLDVTKFHEQKRRNRRRSHSSDSNSNASSSDSDTKSGSRKRRRVENGSRAVVAEQPLEIACNEQVCHLAAQLKTDVLEMIRLVGLLKTWIQLNIPRIEDGNNFGVNIQS